MWVFFPLPLITSASMVSCRLACTVILRSVFFPRERWVEEDGKGETAYFVMDPFVCFPEGSVNTWGIRQLSCATGDI